VHLDYEEHRILREVLVKALCDLGYWRVGTTQIEARGGIEGVTPRRGNECHNELARSGQDATQSGTVVDVQNVDGKRQGCQILPGQSEDPGIEFKANATGH
jgi:hypothetical protein